MSSDSSALYLQAVDIAMDALEQPEDDRADAIYRLELVLREILSAGDTEKADCVRRLIARISP